MDEDMLNLMTMDLWTKVYVAAKINNPKNVLSGWAAEQADKAVEEFKKRFNNDEAH